MILFVLILNSVLLVLVGLSEVIDEYTVHLEMIDEELKSSKKITFKSFKKMVHVNKELLVYDKHYNSLFYKDHSDEYKNWYIHADIIILDGQLYRFRNIVEFYKYWFWKLNLKKYGFKDI
jgi:hypothetical protein